MKPTIEYRPKPKKIISAAFKAVGTPVEFAKVLETAPETLLKPKRSRKKPFATIVETFRTKITVPEAMEVVTKLARPELEAIALEYVIDRARKQKQKAKWQKKWREKANKK